MPGTTTPTAGLEALAGLLHGELVLPGSSAYERARTVWNGMIDRRPAAIAQAVTTSDVAACVRFARDEGVPLAIKAGGHNVAGLAVNDGGLVLDLCRMTAVRIDPTTRLAYVQPGVRWGEFDREAQAFGLATTGGVDSRTGVAGLTLGGGNGYLARAHGLACDNLVAADVVTASGEVVRTTETEHPELLWALRGGGGNFGVVTSFVFRLHAVGPQVQTVQAFYRFEDAHQVLRGYRELMGDAQEAVSVYAMLVRIPPVDAFPAELHGQTAIALAGMYAGALAESTRHLDPFTRLASPILAGLAPTPYSEFQQAFDAGTPDGARYHYRSQFLAGLDDDAITTLLAHVVDPPGEFTIVGIEPMGGATARLPADATAFAHRDAAFNLGIWAGWTEAGDDAAVAAWARGLHEAMAPHGTGGVYVNYLTADETDRVPDAYRGHLPRLAAIKREWDPTNLFQSNHNVAPAASTHGQGDRR